jgi:ketosteroid isomerase-like protein
MTTLTQLVHEHYEAVSRGDLDAALRAFAPDVETVTPTGTLHGVGEFRALGETFAAALEGLHHEVLRTFEDGDTVAVEGLVTGRHTGPLVTPAGTVPPSGHEVSFAFADFLQARDGSFVSHRIYWDNLGLMAQLGVTAPARG